MEGMPTLIFNTLFLISRLPPQFSDVSEQSAAFPQNTTVHAPTYNTNLTCRYLLHHKQWGNSVLHKTRHSPQFNYVDICSLCYCCVNCLTSDSISTNRCTILYIIYFTINLLLHVSMRLPSLGNLYQWC